jgi:two-component system phosphate regulon sensor histidine kinase PhoR
MLARLVREAQALSHDSHEISTGSTITGPAAVLGEERELYSAFSNLVNNAVRYTPKGGSIQLDWQTTPDGAALFSVRDSGPGIESQHLSRLTERFYRIDKGRSRETGGTGLGLAIVKHVASRHGAELKIESTVGQGSCFSLRFPSTRLQTREHPANAVAAPPA